MCLAVPGRITEIFTEDSLRMGRIDYGGVTRTACLEWVPEAEVDDYVLVHVGFALNTLDVEEAEATLRLIDTLQASGEATAASNDAPAEGGA